MEFQIGVAQPIAGVHIKLLLRRHFLHSRLRSFLHAFRAFSFPPFPFFGSTRMRLQSVHCTALITAYLQCIFCICVHNIAYFHSVFHICCSLSLSFSLVGSAAAAPPFRNSLRVHSCVARFRSIPIFFSLSSIRWRYSLRFLSSRLSAVVVGTSACSRRADEFKSHISFTLFAILAQIQASNGDAIERAPSTAAAAKNMTICSQSLRRIDSDRYRTGIISLANQFPRRREGKSWEKQKNDVETSRPNRSHKKSLSILRHPRR